MISCLEIKRSEATLRFFVSTQEHDHIFFSSPLKTFIVWNLEVQRTAQKSQTTTWKWISDCLGRIWRLLTIKTLLFTGKNRRGFGCSTELGVTQQQINLLSMKYRLSIYLFPVFWGNIIFIFFRFLLYFTIYKKFCRHWSQEEQGWQRPLSPAGSSPALLPPSLLISAPPAQGTLLGTTLMVQQWQD